MTFNFSQTAAFIWSVADLLRGDFKQSQYGRIILPFTLLRRLECVLEKSKLVVLAKHAEVSKMGLPEEAYEKLMLRATDEKFFNISPMDLSKLGESGIKDNLETYIQYVPDAWIDAGKRDEKDGELGIVGYEIPFNRHFYVYTPPRALEEIDRDLDAVSREIMALLREVHG